MKPPDLKKTGITPDPLQKVGLNKVEPEIKVEVKEKTPELDLTKVADARQTEGLTDKTLEDKPSLQVVPKKVKKRGRGRTGALKQISRAQHLALIRKGTNRQNFRQVLAVAQGVTDED